MTQEIPKRVKSSPLFCDTCHSPVRLARAGEEFVLRCDCRTLRNVEITEDIPVLWERP